MNILDPILFHCRLQPEAPAICAPGIDLITYGRLEHYINNIGVRAFSLGLGPGQVVAISVSQPVVHAAFVLGLARLGVVTASIGTRPLSGGLRFDAILSDGNYAHPEFKTIRVDPTWVTGDGRPPRLVQMPRGPDLCRIHLTSGTTGESKGVPITHDMMLGRIYRYYAAYGSRFARSSRLYCDMVLGTALGCQLLIWTLAKGGSFFMRGTNAETMLRAFEAYDIETLVAAPSGLAEFVGDFERLRSRHAFELVSAAGSLLSRSLSDRARNHLSPNLICDYGSAETSSAAMAYARDIEHITGAVGYVTPGIVIDIVDETGRSLPTGDEGEIRIRGDFVASGYFGDPDATAKYFRDGWFYPGDNGSLAENGLLIISGRKTVVLNVGGNKINPETIEEVLCSFEGVTAAAALTVVNPRGVEDVWAAITVDRPVDEGLLRAQCERRFASVFVPKRFVVLKTFPTNEGGKIDRHRVAEMLTTIDRSP